jgi:hypothetical protein
VDEQTIGDQARHTPPDNKRPFHGMCHDGTPTARATRLLSSHAYAKGDGRLPLSPRVPSPPRSPHHHGPQRPLQPPPRVHVLFGQVRVTRTNVFILQVLPTPVDVKAVRRLYVDGRDGLVAAS